MSRRDRELDEYARKILAPLRPEARADQDVLAGERARFLAHGESLRGSLIPKPARPEQTAPTPRIRLGRVSLPLFKTLAIAVLVLALVGGSSFTVYAAQSSLPGETLYPIKSASEDIRLNLTFSTQAKLNLTLDYAGRRMSEIQSLVKDGISPSDQTSDRYQQELDQALQLAAELDDQQLAGALNEIKIQAEHQGMTVEELITRLPPQAAPAMLRLQERLQEQVQLSTFGEKDPNQFRLQVRELQQLRHRGDHSTISDEPEIIPFLATTTPEPNYNGNGNGMNQPGGMPGNNGQGNGHNSSSGNGKYTPGSTDAPEP